MEKRKRFFNKLSMDDLLSLDTKDQDDITMGLLVDMEEFVVSTYIEHMALVSLLVRKGIITLEEYIKEKEEVKEQNIIQDLLSNIEEHKKVVSDVCE